MSKYAIGIDYGTQSGRAVVVNIQTGEEVSQATTAYTDGVIDTYLPRTHIKLEHDWALQNPDDYINVLQTAVPQALQLAGIAKEDVIGVGIDFTACTMMPVSQEGKVLCQYETYKDTPHAWIKLWKHHAAQDEANRLNQIARDRGEAFLSRYGGKISSEWLIPKIMQILDEAPEIYEKTYRFMEATDWVTMQMTGQWVRNSCTAGYKAIWHKELGYPDKSFFKALDPRLENLVEEKLSDPIVSIGCKAGVLSKEMADKMGLCQGIAVSVGNVDAHVSAPAVNVVEAGKMLMILGTSGCDILLGDEEKCVEGMCGVALDGAVPGYYAFEAGQSAIGDIFEWFTTQCISAEVMEEARIAGVNIHTLLEQKASLLKPGESGLLALDWWNGNRSVLVDTDLTGLIMGMTLLTQPEEMYRALIEATAYGKRVIVENFNKAGVPVTALYACGGLAEKNKMLMQIYADVMNIEIKISASNQTPALGAAIFAAVAAGADQGGFDNVLEAAAKMANVKDESFQPIPENVAIYDKLFAEYQCLHDYFGRGENHVMKRLKAIKAASRK